MSRARRNRNRVCYYEPVEPSFDDYVFCSSCGDYVYEYCSIHGPLLVIPDDEVPSPTGLPPVVPRAALTIPRTFLHLAPSTIPDAGIGVFSTLTLPKGVRFGPYRGMKTDHVASRYCWQIFKDERKPSHILDARDANKSNWMRYVNCSRHYSEQNLIAFQYQGDLYYRTIKIIPRYTELLVFYGSEFANELNIDVRLYHSPVYTETLVKCEPEDDKQGPTSQKMQLVTSLVTNNTIQDLDSKKLVQKLYDESMQVSSEDKLCNLKESKKENDYIFENENDSYGNEKQFFYGHAGTQNVGTITKNQFKKYSCPSCDATFSMKYEFINHDIRIHNSKKKYAACNLCEYKTEKPSVLKCHIETHRTQKYECDICGYNTPYFAYLKKHIKKHMCKYCNNIFKNRHQLESHIKFHTADKTYDCNKCKSKFLNKSQLMTHLRTHIGKRPHACSICEKKFSCPSHVTRHMTVHSKTRPHTCEICNYNFKQLCHLTRHMKGHADKKSVQKYVV